MALGKRPQRFATHRPYDRTLVYRRPFSVCRDFGEFLSKRLSSARLSFPASRPPAVTLTFGPEYVNLREN